MHPFIIDSKGNLFVDRGSESNACQAQNRQAKSPGIMPCTEFETGGGIWRYDAGKTGQKFSPAERFATGIRNGEALLQPPYVTHRIAIPYAGGAK
jgi:glucose/arabinose dehydrogenase